MFGNERNADDTFHTNEGPSAFSEGFFRQAITMVPDNSSLVSASADLTHLLAAVATGDQRAFSQLYQSSSGHLFAILLRMLRRRDLAEEALQDCFLKVWRKSETYDRGRGAPLDWLSTIARYHALDLLAMRRPEVELPDDDQHPSMLFADPGQSPMDGVIEDEGMARLSHCLQSLPDDQRHSVLLAYYEGYTHQELARTMQAPLGTVKSWVRRGLHHLRQCLERAPESATPAKASDGFPIGAESVPQ